MTQIGLAMVATATIAHIVYVMYAVVVRLSGGGDR